MLKTRVVVVSTLLNLACLACSGTGAPNTPDPPNPIEAVVILVFENIPTSAPSFEDVIEQGFIVRSSSPGWRAAAFGRPAPSLSHLREKTESDVTGELTITSGRNSLFKFVSVDIEASQPSPHEFRGYRGGELVFAESGTTPYAGGGYVAVLGTHHTELIDRLDVAVTTRAYACCVTATATYVDNITLIEQRLP